MILTTAIDTENLAAAITVPHNDEEVMDLVIKIDENMQDTAFTETLVKKLARVLYKEYGEDGDQFLEAVVKYAKAETEP